MAWKGQTFLVLNPYVEFRERLRPSDYQALAQNQDYHEHNSNISVATSYFRKMTMQAYYQWGDGVNFVPPLKQAPVLQNEDVGNLLVSFLPAQHLKIDNTYLYERVRDRLSGASVFDNHIVRSKWNWQFNQQLSLRVILQYNATLANQALTSLQTTKQFNADFLITYLLHPGTAIYVGYNSDLQNYDPTLGVDPVTQNILRTRDGYINDSRQFFVKVSYLFRY